MAFMLCESFDLFIHWHDYGAEQPFVEGRFTWIKYNLSLALIVAIAVQRYSGNSSTPFRQRISQWLIVRNIGHLSLDIRQS